MKQTIARLALIVLAGCAFGTDPEPSLSTAAAQPPTQPAPTVTTPQRAAVTAPEHASATLSGPLSMEAVTDLVRSVGLPDVFALIAFCESSLNPAAVHLNRDGSRDHGLWQINDRWWPELFDGRDPYQPDTAAGMARTVYDRQGLGAWEPSSHCWKPGD